MTVSIHAFTATSAGVVLLGAFFSIIMTAYIVITVKAAGRVYETKDQNIPTALPVPIMDPEGFPQIQSVRLQVWEIGF